MLRLDFTETEIDVLLAACLQLGEAINAGKWEASEKEQKALLSVFAKLRSDQLADLERQKLNLLFSAIHALAEEELDFNYVKTLSEDLQTLCRAANEVVTAAKSFDAYRS